MSSRAPDPDSPPESSVGFTRLSESLGPGGTSALPRRLRGRLGYIVLRNRGTPDKYIGDGGSPP